MQITVTFRGVEPTQALRAYVTDKLERLVRKYLKRPGDAHVILSVAKARHSAEIALQADHVPLVAKETTGDLYAAIDGALARLAHQAQKLKTQRAERKGRDSARIGDGRPPLPRRGRPAQLRVVRERLRTGVLDVDEAVAWLERSGQPFVAFLQEDRGLSVVYRRPDGRIGLIESPA